MENQDKIQIDDRIYVDKGMPYKERAEILLKEAIKRGYGSRGKGYSDNKSLIDIKGIESLVGAGAHIISINKPQIGDQDFIHEVLYKEHRFIAVTGKPFVYVIHGSLTD